MLVSQLNQSQLNNLKRLYEAIWEIDQEIAVEFLFQAAKNGVNSSALKRPYLADIFGGILTWPSGSWKEVYDSLLLNEPRDYL